MALFNKKKKEDVVFPEFPAVPKEPGKLEFPAFSPKEFPSLKEIKQAVSKPELPSLPNLGNLPKLTETMTYEPKQDKERSSDNERFKPHSKQSSGQELPELPRQSLPKQLDIPVRQKQIPAPAVRQSHPGSMPNFQPIQMQRPLPPLPSLGQRPAQFRQPEYAPRQQEQQRQVPTRYESAGKPLFVQIDEYNKIIETVNNLKFSLQEAERILSSLKQLKERENEELSRWDDHLSKVKDKLLSIDKRLFENK